jgi:putative copper resistance protein D
MNALVAVRVAHFAASMLLAGAFAFVLLVIPAASPAARALHRWLVAACGWALVVSVVSWLAWLLLVASAMSGRSPIAALSPDVLDTVLARTTFGRLWMLRLAALVTLAIVLFFWRRRDALAADALYAFGACLAFAQLMTLAGTGHAVATTASLRPVHLAADALHALGAGLWIGALVPLLFVLGRARGRPDAQWHGLARTATRRFSALGLSAVITLLATGLVNAWLLVKSVPALVDTPYGRLVSIKVILFLILVMIAAVNRLKLAPRLTPDPQPHDVAHPAIVQLWRNVALEIAIGALVLSIVGALGTTPPPSHHHDDEMHHDMHAGPADDGIAPGQARYSIFSMTPTGVLKSDGSYTITLPSCLA